MNPRATYDSLINLPPQAQQEVADFIAFLHKRYSVRKKESCRRTGKATNTPISEERFVGIWKDRSDLEDSTAWVRNLRKKEW